MSRLEEYIEKTKQYVEEHKDLTETEIVRYVYLDLGKRFSFDLNFNFGKSEEKVQIYRKSTKLSDLEVCMENNTIICKSLAYIVEYILKEVGINIISSKLDDNKSYPHVHNIVNTSDYGRYVIDLQKDLGNIQSHSTTQFFGLPVMEWKEEPIITRFQLEQIDKKIGYIDKENYYSDDYLYLLKSNMCYFDDLSEKVKFVLENIDICENQDIKYFERKNNHDDILKRLFSPIELTKIHKVDFYQEKDSEKDYKNCIVVDKKGGVDIYVYSNEENMYKSITLDEFIEMADSGLLFPRQSPKLNELLRTHKNNQER